MCTFITLIAASDDLAAINTILASRDRRGQPQRRAQAADMPSLRHLMGAPDRSYTLIAGMCDCGTYLGHLHHQRGAPDADAARAAAIARYRRKGWSAARITRALADQDRKPPRHQQPKDDVDYWIDLLGALGRGLGLPRLGLMHYFYHKDDGPPPDIAARCHAGPANAATLAQMPMGIIHDFDLLGQ